jgi:hypothetical protein
MAVIPILRKWEDCQFKDSLSYTDRLDLKKPQAKRETLAPKTPEQKRAGDVTQELEHFA